jgi:hypothetical protein
MMPINGVNTPVLTKDFEMGGREWRILFWHGGVSEEQKVKLEKICYKKDSDEYFWYKGSLDYFELAWEEKFLLLNSDGGGLNLRYAS